MDTSVPKRFDLIRTRVWMQAWSGQHKRSHIRSPQTVRRALDTSRQLPTRPHNECDQLLDATRGRPFGVYIHGNEGTEGAEWGITAITTGLGWVQSAETVVVMGKPSKADVEACWNLGATVAAQLMG